MRPRQPLPAIWLMTDERMGEGLWQALERMPRGAGVIFRHYAAAERRVLFERVRQVCRRRRLLLLLAGPPQLAIVWRADGAHGSSVHRRAARPLVRSAPCHSRRELVRARGADLRFISPIFPTRSHPEADVLGMVRAGLMIRREKGVLIALGGMTSRRGRVAGAIGFDGWAAIDAFL